jgi:hypothetical protein
LSHQGVADRITAALAQLVVPAAEEYRAMETVRLDTYLGALSPQIEGGDFRAVGTAVRISERRSKLLGLDAPEAIDAVVRRRMDEETQAILEALRMGLAAVLDRMGLSYVAREPWQEYGLAMALYYLGGREGPLPAAPSREELPAPVAPVPAVEEGDLMADFRRFAEREGFDPDGLDDGEDGDDDSE